MLLKLLLIAAIAFGLNFIWEVVQCPLFFLHLALQPTWTGMLIATMGDVVLTMTAYFFVAAGTRDSNWYLKPRWSAVAWVALEITALVLSIEMERLGLSMKRWSYINGTPMLPIFDVSLVPVLQLLILFPLTFWGARYLYSRRRN